MKLLNPISRGTLYSFVPTDKKLLEIGPFAKPQFRSPQYDVAYADIMTSEQMAVWIEKNEQQEHYDISQIPEKIDILIDPRSTPAFNTELKFGAIYSSHNIEHHPDIVNHLLEMASVSLDNSTEFVLAIPDKRYCFDHFQHASSYAEMIGAHLEDRRNNLHTTVLQDYIFRAHNDSKRHWDNEHDSNPWHQPITAEWITKIKGIIEDAKKVDTEYVDAHAWKFTPFSFGQAITVLNSLGLQPWRIHAIYDTAPGSNEFYAVLRLD
jgi:hypothetical protein